MLKFLTKNIELQDKKIWKNIAIGIIYFCSIILLSKMGAYFLELPILLTIEYNISMEEVSLIYSNNYIWGIIAIMLITVLTLPVYIALNRIKRGSKNGLEFYSEEELQNSANVIEKDKSKINNQIKDIVETDDTHNNDEEAEKELFIEEPNKELINYKLIKNRMLPLTMKVTIELYNHCRTDITYETILQYVKIISNYKRKRGTEDKSKKIAKSILDFLNKNGIIESDEGCENKYYFTIFGNTYMYYFISGII